MKRKEAIEQLQDAKDGYKEYLSNDAINIAIEAIEQEPTTKNDLGGDCISRQEAIDTIRQLYIDLATQKYVIDLLKVLPSVTPQEPKIGHWILGGYDDYYYICDKCNYKASEYYFKPRYNYCPNCGAKMESEE